MAAAKEIRGKIASIKNTEKITRAMQMVATSKMRKTQQKMREARPYANHIRRVIAHLAEVDSYARNISPLLRDVAPSMVKNVGIILITSDKGLCGGLNANAIKLFYEKVHAFKRDGVTVSACTLGTKGYNAAKRIGIPLASFALNLGDVPQIKQIIGAVDVMLDGFQSGTFDSLYIVYSHFHNTMRQVAVYERLLPLVHKHLHVNQENTQVHHKSTLPWNYEYEPSGEVVVNELIRRYMESVVYQCMADNMASEMASRMVAMKAATDNAKSAINRLKLIYNKTRQAAITKELSEIVAGSAAV